MHRLNPEDISFYMATAGVILSSAYLWDRISPLSLMVLALSAAYAVSKRAQLGTTAQLAIILPFFAWTILHISPENLIEPLTGLTVVIASAKIAGERKRRDQLQIYLLNQLILTGAAVMKFGLGFGLLLLAEALISICGLLFLYAAHESGEISATAAFLLINVGILTTACTTILTAFYFLVLPRPQFTILSASFGNARTGLTDHVSPKEIASLKEDKTIAFRVVWKKGTPPSNPFFRAFVYRNYFKGKWEANLSRIEPQKPSTGTTITVEGIPLVTTKGLPVPGYAFKVKPLRRGKAYIGAGGTALIKKENEPSIYRVKAVHTPFLPADEDPSTYTNIPKSIKKALIPLAQKLKGKTPHQSAQNVVNFLKKNYRYTLNPGKAKGDPTLWFLFHSRKGHCEYFASAMALLLRTMGIPARVVGGYATGEWNPIGHYYILRQKDAHTWVEVYIPQRGWMTYDPTPPALQKVISQNPLLFKLRMLWDYLQLRWYYWVVEYDLLKQQRLLSKITGAKTPSPDPKKITCFITLTLIPILLILAGKRKPRTPVEELLKLFERERPKLPGETIQEYLSKVLSKHRYLSPLLRQFLDLYYREAYRGEDTSSIQRSLITTIKKMYKRNNKAL